MFNICFVVSADEENSTTTKEIDSYLQPSYFSTSDLLQSGWPDYLNGFLAGLLCVLIIKLSLFFIFFWLQLINILVDILGRL